MQALYTFPCATTLLHLAPIIISSLQAAFHSIIATTPPSQKSNSSPDECCGLMPSAAVVAALLACALTPDKSSTCPTVTIGVFLYLT